MIYTIDEIKRRIEPVAKEYGVKQVYLFGSYARGEATEESDVDLLVDAPDVQGLRFVGLSMDFENALGKQADVLELEDCFAQYHTGSDFINRYRAEFQGNARKDMMRLYEGQ